MPVSVDRSSAADLPALLVKGAAGLLRRCRPVDHAAGVYR